jgi:hypothetical protein
MSLWSKSVRAERSMLGICEANIFVCLQFSRLAQRPAQYVASGYEVLTTTVMFFLRYRVFSAQADLTLTQTSHKDTEQSTTEASIKLGITLTDSLIM